MKLKTCEIFAKLHSKLYSQGSDVNAKAKNGLTPIHLCAQEDKVGVARLLVDSGAECDAETKAGYTPLHVAAHFGQVIPASDWSAQPDTELSLVRSTWSSSCSPTGSGSTCRTSLATVPSIR